MGNMDEYRALHAASEQPSDKEREAARRAGAEWGFAQRRLLADDPDQVAWLQTNPDEMIRRLEAAMRERGLIPPSTTEHN